MLGVDPAAEFHGTEPYGREVVPSEIIQAATFREKGGATQKDSLGYITSKCTIDKLRRKAKPFPQPHSAKRTALEPGRSETDPVEIAPIEGTIAVDCLSKPGGLTSTEVTGAKAGTSEVAGIKTAPAREKKQG